MQSPMPLTTGASTALVSALSVTISPPLASTLSQTSAAGLLKRIAKPQADGPCCLAKSAANESGSDRKSVVSGKSVSVRVDLGGRRFIKKKKEHTTKARHEYTKRNQQNI